MKKNNSHYLFSFFFVLIIFCVSGCKANNTNNPTTTNSITDDGSDFSRFENVVKQESYLDDCKSIYDINLTQQKGFYNIYPGKTHEDEVLKYLGEPIETTETKNNSTELLYYDESILYSYSVEITNGIVSSIYIYSDKNELLQVEAFLNLFGCPNLIVASELDPDPFSENTVFNSIFFVYINLGVEIRFDGYPIKYSDMASIVTYIIPSNIDDYIRKNDNFLINSSSKPVNLLEAVH